MNSIYKKVIYHLLVTALLLPALVFASPREDAIKSGFLYNFARYSDGEWFNSETETKYRICSFNKAFFDVAKAALKDLKVKERPVVINLLVAQTENINQCNSLYIAKEDMEKWSSLSDMHSDSKMMLVGDFEGFIKMGGHINFFNVGGKIRFEIDPQKLKKSGINMSSKVLRLGKIYKAGY